MNCKICKEQTKFDLINSYKYIWYFCKSCKNIFSINKKKESNFILRMIVKLLTLLTKQKRISKLLLYDEQNNKDFYKYYINALGPDYKKNNKWENYDKEFILYLKENNIDLKNKSILSISDEPGFISNSLKKFTNDITFTALDADVAKTMKAKLECDVKKYDLNNDKLSEIFKKKFDLIFFRSTLNFNLNFDDLVNETKKISNENTIIIFNFHSVSTSSCLMWMFDDYSLKSLINLNYIKKIISNKFLILKEYKVIFNPRKHYYNTFAKKLFYYPFFLYYFFQFKINFYFKKYEIEFNSEEIGYRLILKNIK